MTMFSKLYSFFFGNKSKKIRKEIDKKYQQAVQYQRNGKIREYSVIMNEIANLEDEYERLQDS